MSVNSNETNRLLQAAAVGDQQAWSALLIRHRQRLRRMVSLRTDERLQGQIDASDVLRRAGCEAAARLAEYLREPNMPFFLWMRSIAGETLAVQHRQQIGSGTADPQEPVTLYRGSLPVATTATLASQLMGHQSRLTDDVIRFKMKIYLQQAVNGLDRLDREILTLRHFEQLSNVETAYVLDIDPSDASRRYIRALMRLKGTLSYHPNELGAASGNSPPASSGASPEAVEGTITLQTLSQPESRRRWRMMVVALAAVAITLAATIAAVFGW